MSEHTYQIKLSAKAENDFVCIQRYTLKKYGHKQTLKYSEQIKTAFEKLKRNPETSGKQRPDIPKNYRSYKVGEHHIIYRIHENEIYVLAILHGKRNFAARIP